METTGFVFVCIIFSIMLGVAGCCCLRVCSSESPYISNDASPKNSSVSSISIGEILLNGYSTAQSNPSKNSASVTNGIETQPRSQVRSIRSPKPRIKVNDDNTTVYSIAASLYPPKPLSVEHRRSLDKLTIERETHRARSRSRSPCPPSSRVVSEIKVETSTPESIEEFVKYIDPESSTETKNISLEPLHLPIVSSGSPSYLRKTRYSSEPPLPSPPSCAETIAIRWSLVEPPLPREYLI